MSLVDKHSEISARDALEILRGRVLLDDYPFIVDLDASRGCYLHDALSDKDYLDFYTFYASQPIGYNHPRITAPDFRAELAAAAITKPANSDSYTRQYAEFVRTFDEIAAPNGFDRFFFIDGGALAVENALKAAFDWKVRKNIAAGRAENAFGVIHFKQAFHGRSGYTLSITSTHNPAKTMYFPKFDWPRIDNPQINFALDEPGRSADVGARERTALVEIERIVADRGEEMAAVIIEPIQGEGGDNHFRGEFLAKLREICEQHEMLLIFDEVQTGLGVTGRMWCFEHFDVAPDIVCFGKKTQVCGIMAGPRLDEVEQNVFRTSARINSTFGGNLTDMVRAAEYLRIIRDEELVENAETMGGYLFEALGCLAEQHAAMTALRGRGLLCAFDLPDEQTRDAVRKACYEREMLILGCGERTLRFRPVLDVDRSEIDAGISILDQALRAVL